MHRAWLFTIFCGLLLYAALPTSTQANTRAVSNPSFSHDGKQIVYTETDGRRGEGACVEKVRLSK